MHNGGIADFHLMKRHLQKELPDVAFDMVQGNTGMSPECIRPSTRTPWHSLDSEWAFALFLSKVSYLFLGILHSDRGRDSFPTAMPGRSRPKRCEKPWLRRLRR
jgi:hypothetical protein